MDAASGCGITQFAIRAREHASFDEKGCGKVNRVIPSKSFLLGKVGGLCDESLGDFYDGETFDKLAQRGLGFAVGGAREPATTLRRRERGTRLHDHERGRRQHVGCPPDHLRLL